LSTYPHRTTQCPDCSHSRRSNTGPRTTRRPDLSQSGRGDCHTQGYHRAAETPTVDLKNGIKTLLRPPGRPGGREKGIFRVMLWNSEGMLFSCRELALLNLLNNNNVDVSIVTETKIPFSGHGDYNVEGYHSYLPLSPSKLLKTAKYRIVVLVQSVLATATKVRSDLMHAAVRFGFSSICKVLPAVRVLLDLWVPAFWFAACTGSGQTLSGRRSPCPRSGSSCRQRPQRWTTSSLQATSTSTRPGGAM
jgi:hypothetical protein